VAPNRLQLTARQ